VSTSGEDPDVILVSEEMENIEVDKSLTAIELAGLNRHLVLATWHTIQLFRQ